MTTASEPTSAYLSVAAAAELLGVSRTELRRRIRLGELEVSQVGTQTLVHRCALERYLAPIQLAGGRTLDRRRLRDE